jgi:hypothetical protein
MTPNPTTSRDAHSRASKTDTSGALDRGWATTKCLALSGTEPCRCTLRTVNSAGPKDLWPVVMTVAAIAVLVVAVFGRRRK